MKSSIETIPFRDASKPLVIPTERVGLRVRQLLDEDIPAFYEAVATSRAHLDQYGSKNLDAYATHELIGQAIDPSAPVMTLGIEQGDRFVGGFKVTPELDESGALEAAKLGIWVRSGETRQNIATLATVGVAAFLHNRTGARGVYARVAHTNGAPKGVLQAAGFEFSGQTADHLGRPVDLFDLQDPRVITNARYDRFDGAHCEPVAIRTDEADVNYVELNWSQDTTPAKLAVNSFLHDQTLTEGGLAVPTYTLHG